jgi:hypothetical protein
MYITEPGDQTQAATLARSSPRYGENDEMVMVAGNTAFEMLEDFAWGTGQIHHAYRFFSCPDVYKQIDQFCCTRKDWRFRYRSVVVLPVKVTNQQGVPEIIGVVTFDSLTPGAFELPDAIAFRADSSGHVKFWNQVQSSAVAHTMGLITDMIAITIEWVFMESAPGKEKSDTGQPGDTNDTKTESSASNERSSKAVISLKPAAESDKLLRKTRRRQRAP